MQAHAILDILYQRYLSCSTVATDSRHIIPNALFFALQGPRFNGNAFADQALAQGAAYAVVDEAPYKKDDRYILVADTLTALQRLATYHRKQLNIPIIALTGSCGKTTTKELLHVVLRQRYATAVTKGNLNNHIGVPLSLLAIPPTAAIAVIEMGANHIGEIAQLCQLVLPTHGLITNLGPVHLAGFGSFSGVIKGKMELYDYLHQHQGQVFINTTDPILQREAQRFRHPILYPHDFSPCTLVEANPYVVYQSETGTRVTSQLLGKHHFDTIATALCLAKYFGIEEHLANQAIQSYVPVHNRSQLISKGSNTLLLDAYNANPVSVKNSIDTLQLLPAAHKILILGDMAELGSASSHFHQEIVHYTTQGHYQAVLLCGPRMQAVKAYNPTALYFEHKEDLAAYLQQRTFENTAFLIKGSRFLGLETLSACIA